MWPQSPATEERISMSRITDAFKNTKAFIPFITCGDPDIEMTETLVTAMCESGADIVELGLPFSDPIAEGPVIQGADERALQSGTTTDKVFDMVTRLRKTIDTPFVIMTYANPVFVYGCDRFMMRCRETGVDGLIVPDVPYEERETFLPYCRKYGVELISMIAPTSRDRICEIASQAEGFLYCVSSLGVTGMRTSFSSGIAEMVQEVKKVRPDLPCAVGFGISKPEHSTNMARIADGVIVGSAIVNIVAEHSYNAEEYVRKYVRAMKDAALKAL